MNYEQLLSNRTQFLSLTSLEPTEFTHLLTIFTPLWEKYYRYHTTLGKKRKIVFPVFLAGTPVLEIQTKNLP